MTQLLQKGTVLIVDDDNFQLEILGQQLHGLGWSRLLFAGSGQAALQLFDTHKADIRLIISDLSMPDMDGLVLMRHFAQRELDAAMILISGVRTRFSTAPPGWPAPTACICWACWPSPIPWRAWPGC